MTVGSVAGLLALDPGARWCGTCIVGREGLLDHLDNSLHIAAAARVVDLIREGKAGCALCGCVLERPPVTTPGSVAAFVTFAGVRPIDPYIATGICLACSVEPDLPDRLIRHFQIEELPFGHC